LAHNTLLFSLKIKTNALPYMNLKSEELIKSIVA